MDDTLQLQVASPDEAPHADGFDPSSAVPVEPVHSDGFDPNNAVDQDGFNPTSAVPAGDYLADDAIKKIEAHISGQVTYDPDTLAKLNQVAQAGKGAWGRLGSAAYNIITDPAGDAKAAGNFISKAGEGVEHVVNKLQDPLVGLGNAIGKGMEGGSFSDVPQAALEAGKGEAHNAWDLIGGGATGLGNLATSAVSLGNEVGDLALEPFGIDTTGNDVGIQNLQNQAAKQAHEFNQKAGINEQSPLYAAGENILPSLVPIGGEALGAKTAAKIADAAVESVPKVAGAALKTVGTTGKVAGPAAIAAAEVATGHPYKAMIALAAGYGPDGIPVVSRLKHAIIDKGFGGMNELGNVLTKLPEGVPMMEGFQQSVSTEIDRLQQQSQDIIKRAGPDKTSDAFKTIPDGNPLYESDELSGDAKKLRDLQDRIENLHGRSDMLGKFIGANKLISGAAKLGIQTGLNVGGAGAIGAAFAGTQAAPGDNQAIQQGFGAGAALGALGAPIANREGTLAMGRDALISRGSRVIDPTSLQGLSPEAQAHITTLAGMADAIGRKVVVLPPDQLLQMVSPNKPEVVPAPEPAMAEASMPPAMAKDAPNGVTIGNTLYLNRDAIGTGVGNHELTHATSEFFGRALAEADPELMDAFNQTYQSRLSRTGDYEFDPQSERDAEVGRIALQSTPLETFYGGEKPGDIIKRMAFNLAQKIPALRAKANVYQVDSVLNAPYSPADLQAIRQRMFEVGEIAKRGGSSAPGPPSRPDLASATLTPETQQNAPTKPVGTPATPKTVDPQTVNDAVAGMVGLGLKKTDAQAKVNGAVQDLTNEGKELTTEAIVARAAQRAVPKPMEESPQVPESNAVSQNPPQPVAPASDTASPQSQDQLSGARIQSQSESSENSPQSVAHPDYESIRKTAEDAKREEPKSSKAKDKESKIERAGLDAMAKAHADFVGPYSPLITQRTTRFGRTSISGRAADPSDPFNAHLIQQANLSPKATENMNALEANMGKPIVIDYTHAPEQEEASGISRKVEQAESTASDRAEGTAPGRKLSKSYVPTSFTYNAPSKTFEVNGFSPDKFLNNAAQLIPWAKGKGLKGWESINDPQFVQDFQAAMKNGSNGYTISGKPIEGTESTPVKVNPDYKPAIIPKDKADLLNAMLGNDSAKVGVRAASPEKLDKQALAAKNSPFYEPSTGETNKIRSMLGDEAKLLESTSETLRPDLIDNVRTGNVADEHTLRPSGFTGGRSELVSGGTPNQHMAASGFMPNTILDSAIKNHGETNNLDEAGYVLPDGRLIDFSGRRQAIGYNSKTGKSLPGQPDYLNGSRNIDHREVKFDGSDRLEDGYHAMVQMMEAGAARIDAKAGAIELHKPPTSSQERTIKSILQSADGSIDLQDGNRHAYLTPDQGSEAKTIGLIRRFYRGEDIAPGKMFMPSTEIPKPLAKTAEAYSLKYNGIMGDEGKKQLHLFSDPVTKSTFSVPVDATGDQLRSKLESVRDRFLNPDNLAFMPSNAKDAISMAAVKLSNGKIFTDVMHLGAMQEARAQFPKRDWTYETGFVTKSGKFLTREEALAHAKSIGQVTKVSLKKADEFYGSMPGGSGLESLQLAKARQFMPSDTERIVGTANLLSNGRIAVGERPNSIHPAIYTHNENIYPDENAVGVQEGFITNMGRFVTREEAASLSKSNLTTLGAEHLTKTGNLSRANIEFQKKIDIEDGQRSRARAAQRNRD